MTSKQLTGVNEPGSAFRVVLVGLLVAAILILGILIVGIWWKEGRFTSSKRATHKFTMYLNQERYEEADQMLRPPCSIELAPDGSLRLVDEGGTVTTVPASKLPFIVGGGDPKRANESSMTALGESTNGILHSPPVIIYLDVSRGEVGIEVSSD